MLAIDFEKAFDTAEWIFLDKTFEYFGFGEKFRQWIKIFYTDISSCLSKSFKVTRGIRQGCCISSLNFICCAEILCINLKADKNISKIMINNIIELIEQFADDTTLLLEVTQQNLLAMESIFKRPRDQSGLTINYNKTEILRIGSLSNTDFK